MENLIRYYIPPGMFSSREELEACPGVPSEKLGSLWISYERGDRYLSVWVTNGKPSQWGFFNSTSLEWALNQGYVLFPKQTEEVLI